MKKILTVIFIMILMVSCQSAKNIVTTVDGIDKNRETAEFDTEKSRRIAEMPDISVFFPEEEVQNSKHSNSLWSADGKSLYGDGRASRIGDIVFISINEEATANLGYTHTKDGYTDYVPEENLEKEVKPGEEVVSTEEIEAQKRRPQEETTAKRPKPSATDYNGTASSQRGTSFSGKIAARVEAVDKYGNLYLKGTKTTLLNNEIVTLEVTGYARKEDVTIENSIDSAYLENMEFSYNGAMYVGEPKVTNIGDNQEILKETEIKAQDSKGSTGKSSKPKKKWFFGLF